MDLRDESFKGFEKFFGERKDLNPARFRDMLSSYIDHIRQNRKSPYLDNMWGFFLEHGDLICILFDYCGWMEPMLSRVGRDMKISYLCIYLDYLKRWIMKKNRLEGFSFYFGGNVLLSRIVKKEIENYVEVLKQALELVDRSSRIAYLKKRKAERGFCHYFGDLGDVRNMFSVTESNHVSSNYVLDPPFDCDDTTDTLSKRIYFFEVYLKDLEAWMHEEGYSTTQDEVKKHNSRWFVKFLSQNPDISPLDLGIVIGLYLDHLQHGYLMGYSLNLETFITHSSNVERLEDYGMTKDVAVSLSKSLKDDIPAFSITIGDPEDGRKSLLNRIDFYKESLIELKIWMNGQKK